MEHPTLALLKSRALLAAGRKAEARAMFRTYLSRRGDD
jgi:type III secretion protein Y